MDVYRSAVQVNPEDVAGVRFAVSPLLEMVTSYRAVQSRSAVFAPWLTRRGEVARQLGGSHLRFLVQSGAYVPDFLTPKPQSPVERFADELARLLETPYPQVHEELRQITSPTDTVLFDRYLDDTGEALKALAEELTRYWQAVIEPDWPRLRTVLEADVLYRSRRLAEGGPAALLAELHPRVRCGAGHAWPRPDGQGLTLVPSVFAWPDGYMVYARESPFTFAYPARGTAELWAPWPAPPAPLAELMGQTAARLLLALSEPRTTTGLSALLGGSASGVSPHLHRLKALGLATSTRQGKRVWYEWTQRGQALARLFQEEPR
ncbi:hypothetical protein [Deinococcus aestuarii]|uniref:hypothetical protein n=1 Tax=Deinococcus aestuarii TaxID=2774531 RepID=UPI001C0E64A5|nr:hypothetical protein [Deinococcus aestuarii]